MRKARSRAGPITVTFVRSTIITAARTVVSDPLMLAAQPRRRAMDGVRAHRIAGNVVDRHEEKESERTKNDHPWIRRKRARRIRVVLSKGS